MLFIIIPIGFAVKPGQGFGTLALGPCPARVPCPLLSPLGTWALPRREKLRLSISSAQAGAGGSAPLAPSTACPPLMCFTHVTNIEGICYLKPVLIEIAHK